jgi:hypothetical protein
VQRRETHFRETDTSTRTSSEVTREMSVAQILTHLHDADRDSARLISVSLERPYAASIPSSHVE